MSNKNQNATLAKNGKNVTLEKNDGKKQVKPYCEAAKEAAEAKRKADELRPAAVEWLQTKLNNDPELKSFTGTIVCMYDGVLYKLRIQRPDNTDWSKKNLKDEPNLVELKQCYKDRDALKARIAELEDELEKAHPKCVERGFVVSFLSK